MAWVTWRDWVRQPWDLYKIPDQEEITQDEKDKLMEEQQRLSEQLQEREDRIGPLVAKLTEARPSRDFASMRTLTAQRQEANEGMDKLRQEIETKRKRRLGLEESEPVLDKDDGQLQEIQATCRRCGLSSSEAEKVVQEVLRAHKEQRTYDSSTLVARTMPWDPISDEVMTPKRVLELMHHALQQARRQGAQR